MRLKAFSTEVWLLVYFSVDVCGTADVAARWFLVVARLLGAEGPGESGRRSGAGGGARALVRYVSSRRGVVSPRPLGGRQPCSANTLVKARSRTKALSLFGGIACIGNENKKSVNRRSQSVSQSRQSVCPEEVVTCGETSRDARGPP